MARPTRPGRGPLNEGERRSGEKIKSPGYNYILFPDDDEPYPALDPISLATSCESSGIDISWWVGRANSFYSPRGSEIGRGFILLDGETTRKLAKTKGKIELQFGKMSATLEVLFSQAFSIFYVPTDVKDELEPSEDVPYLVEFVDLRWLAHMSVVTRSYNVSVDCAANTNAVQTHQSTLQGTGGTPINLNAMGYPVYRHTSGGSSKNHYYGPIGGVEQENPVPIGGVGGISAEEGMGTINSAPARMMDVGNILSSLSGYLPPDVRHDFYVDHVSAAYTLENVEFFGWKTVDALEYVLSSVGHMLTFSSFGSRFSAIDLSDPNRYGDHFIEVEDTTHQSTPADLTLGHDAAGNLVHKIVNRDIRVPDVFLGMFRSGDVGGFYVPNDEVRRPIEGESETPDSPFRHIESGASAIKVNPLSYVELKSDVLLGISNSAESPSQSGDDAPKRQASRQSLRVHESPIPDAPPTTPPTTPSPSNGENVGPSDENNISPYEGTVLGVFNPKKSSVDSTPFSEWQIANYDELKYVVKTNFKGVLGPVIEATPSKKTSSHIEGSFSGMHSWSPNATYSGVAWFCTNGNEFTRLYSGGASPDWGSKHPYKTPADSTLPSFNDLNLRVLGFPFPMEPDLIPVVLLEPLFAGNPHDPQLMTMWSDIGGTRETFEEHASKNLGAEAYITHPYYREQTTTTNQQWIGQRRKIRVFDFLLAVGQGEKLPTGTRCLCKRLHDGRFYVVSAQCAPDAGDAPALDDQDEPPTRNTDSSSNTPPIDQGY